MLSYPRGEELTSLHDTGTSSLAIFSALDVCNFLTCIFMPIMVILQQLEYLGKHVYTGSVHTSKYEFCSCISSPVLFELLPLSILILWAWSHIIMRFKGNYGNLWAQEWSLRLTLHHLLHSLQWSVLGKGFQQQCKIHRQEWFPQRLDQSHQVGR